MIYVNGNIVSDTDDIEIAAQDLKGYLATKRLLIVNDAKEPMSHQQLSAILSSNTEEIRLAAIETSVVLRAFKEELAAYILKVEQYIESTRETEDYSTVLTSYTQVTEALLDFSVVEEFLQKDLLDHQYLSDISSKCLKRGEEGNFEYILDIMEYELLPLFENFIKETNEVM